MRKINQTILILMFLALTGLAGCTTGREPVALIEPSFSYLRDIRPTPKIATPPVEAAKVAPVETSKPAVAEPAVDDLISDARPVVQPDTLPDLYELFDLQMFNPTLNIAANTMRPSDSTDHPDPIAVFVRQ